MKSWKIPREWGVKKWGQGRLYLHEDGQLWQAGYEGSSKHKAGNWTQLSTETITPELIHEIEVAQEEEKQALLRAKAERERQAKEEEEYVARSMAMHDREYAVQRLASEKMKAGMGFYAAYDAAEEEIPAIDGKEGV